MDNFSKTSKLFLESVWTDNVVQLLGDLAGDVVNDLVDDSTNDLTIWGTISRTTESTVRLVSRTSVLVFSKRLPSE